MEVQDRKYMFSVEDAVRYGVAEAIMLQNIRFWVMTNKAKQSPMHNKVGRFWTFNSAREFTKFFPFWTEKQIERILKSLIAQEAVLKNSFNKRRYDRTLWYTINDDSSLSRPSEQQSVSPNGGMDSAEQSEGIPQDGEPIPDLNSISKSSNISVSTTKPSDKANSAFEDEKKPKEEEKNTSEPLVLGLDQAELESLVQVKYLDDRDQSFLADIVDRPWDSLTPKQMAKLQKIRKKAVNGKKIAKLRPKNPDDIASEQKRALKLALALGEFRSFSDTEVMTKHWRHWISRVGPNETVESVRLRCEAEINLQYVD